MERLHAPIVSVLLAVLLFGCDSEKSSPTDPSDAAIPKVTGLKVALDTAGGVATLSWTGTSYSNAASYVIYRNLDPSQTLAAVAGITKDTVFVDSLRKVYSQDDFNVVYRVRILDDGDDLGPASEGLYLHVPSPATMSSISDGVYVVRFHTWAGRLFAFGSDEGEITVWEYDRAKNRWTPGGVLKVGEEGWIHSVPAEGKYYLLFERSRRFSEYDFSTGAWTKKASPSGLNISLSVTLTKVGGVIFANPGEYHGYLSLVIWRYDIASDQWSEFGMGGQSKNLLSCMDRLFLWTNSQKLNEFDPITNTWVERTGNDTLESYPIFMETENRLLFYLQGYEGGQVLGYDPVSMQWTKESPDYNPWQDNQEIMDPFVLLNGGGSVYLVIAGNDSLNIHRHDPLKGGWTELPDAPVLGPLRHAIYLDHRLFLESWNWNGSQFIEYRLPPE